MQLLKALCKFFGVWLICLCTSPADSQVIIALLFGDKLNSDKLEFGLSGGLNQSYLTNFTDTKSKSGFNIGLYFNIKLDDKWFIRAEAVPKFPTGASKLNPYSLQDANLDSLLQDGDVTRKIKNIALPILIRYRIKNLLFAEAGPQLDLRTKAKDVFEVGDLTYKNKIEDNITRFDFGFAFGLTQKLNKNIGSMAFGIRYYMGVTDIDKLTQGSQKNGVFQILASVPVGTGKQKQKGKD
ncbi:MAG TPA: porin family protein [Chitinophagaceae bacterium]|jgi:hypothetical protein